MGQAEETAKLLRLGGLAKVFDAWLISTGEVRSAESSCETIELWRIAKSCPASQQR